MRLGLIRGLLLVLGDLCRDVRLPKTQRTYLARISTEGNP
jgi:hypothetical protein